MGSCYGCPQCALIPRTGSVAHLRENLAAERMALDDEALRNLDAVAPWPDDPSPRCEAMTTAQDSARGRSAVVDRRRGPTVRAAAWIGGLLAVFIPLSVWRYRRIS